MFVVLLQQGGIDRAECTRTTVRMCSRCCKSKLRSHLWALRGKIETFATDLSFDSVAHGTMNVMRINESALDSKPVVVNLNGLVMKAIRIVQKMIRNRFD